MDNKDYEIYYKYSNSKCESVYITKIVETTPGSTKPIDLTFPNSVITSQGGNFIITDLCFDWDVNFNKRIRTLHLPNQIRHISSKEIFRESNIEYLYFPKLLRFIGDRAFMNNSNLKIVNFSQDNFNLLSISNGCFKGCENLVTVNLPPKIVQIDSQCFMNCKNLDRIVIPPRVLSILDKAFFGTKTSRVIFLGPKPKLSGETTFHGGRKERIAFVKSEYINDYLSDPLYTKIFNQILTIESEQLVIERISDKYARVIPKIGESGLNTYYGKIIIPEFIYIGKKKYIISEINPFSFYECDVKELIIPKTINIDNVFINPEVKIISV